MRRILGIVGVVVALLVPAGCYDSPRSPTAPTLIGPAGVVQRTSVQVFDVAGSEGGGVLTPGQSFPATGGSMATLDRQDSCLEYTLETTGLPPGAYTNWWIIFNNPATCVGADFGSSCGLADLAGGTPVDVAAFWAAGGVVQGDGVGNFASRTCIGSDLGYPAIQHLFGPGLLDPQNAVVWIIVKYHGPASDNEDVLHWQTYSVLGSCFEGANAVDLGPPFGINCFDPQVATFDPPGGIR